MKKKDAIERLAALLESNDQVALGRATEAAGAAAEVIPIIKDYKALAKEYMARAETEVAFKRAMQQIERQLDVPLVNTKPAALPDQPMCQYRGNPGHIPFHYKPLPKLKEAGGTVEGMIAHGWTAEEMAKNGYIAL